MFGVIVCCRWHGILLSFLFGIKPNWIHDLFGFMILAGRGVGGVTGRGGRELLGGRAQTVSPVGRGLLWLDVCGRMSAFRLFIAGWWE